MFFVVTGMDGTDENAPQRRQDARSAHLQVVKENYASGMLLMAAAFVNDEDQMIGSNMIVQVENRADVDAWLEIEPYIIGKVWETVEVRPCKVPPLFLG